MEDSIERDLRTDVESNRRLLTDGGEDEEGEGESQEAEGEESSEGEGDESEGEEAQEGGEDEAAEGEEDEEGQEGEAEGEEGEEEEPQPPERDDETGVLYLNLGEGLFLDLLGLEVDLEQVELDVRAQPGEGKLLGNLLGAVGGLLDKPDIVGKIKSLFGGIGDLFGGGEVEEGEGLGSRISGGVKSMLSNLPVDKIISQLVSSLVKELTSKDESSGESESGESPGETEEAAA